MWDIKLLSLDLIKNNFFFFFTSLNFFINLITNFSHNSISIDNNYITYDFVFNNSIIFAIKFVLSIAFLILIRGGTPRYRYDFLTKLGWLKFINIIILIFFFSFINFYLF